MHLAEIDPLEPINADLFRRVMFGFGFSSSDIERTLTGMRHFESVEVEFDFTLSPACIFLLNRIGVQVERSEAECGAR